jgi:hypothetical protein
MKTYSVKGTYGRSKTPTEVFVLERYNGLRYYASKGSINVNATYDQIDDGVDIEELRDIDCFTWSKGINTLNQLEKAVNG